MEQAAIVLPESTRLIDAHERQERNQEVDARADLYVSTAGYGRRPVEPGHPECYENRDGADPQYHPIADRRPASLGEEVQRKQEWYPEGRGPQYASPEILIRRLTGKHDAGDRRTERGEQHRWEALECLPSLRDEECHRWKSHVAPDGFRSEMLNNTKSHVPVYTGTHIHVGRWDDGTVGASACATAYHRTESLRDRYRGADYE